MSMALAHALEVPGKMRLDKQTYLAVQGIYYPGFTLGGIAEPLAVIATLVLMLLMRDHGSFLVGPVSIRGPPGDACDLLVDHAARQPTLAEESPTRNHRTKFFALDRANLPAADTFDSNWQRFRDRWEYSHIARAVFSAIALIALAVAIAI
ncbi:MAG TPA: hypothetical protein VNZ03_01850 [Terriglobales bacterium]|jgi:hypothetical protein|nr:hypothetical protein [Terriglobales bacterium]